MIKAIIFDCFGVVLDVRSNYKIEPVVEYISSLKGQFKLAMLSNVPSRESLDRRFVEGELDQLFDVVVASGDTGYEKPQPEIYQLTAAQLGVQPDECLFIDDIDRFCEAADIVGMQTHRFIDPEFSLNELKLKVEGLREHSN